MGQHRAFLLAALIAVGALLTLLAVSVASKTKVKNVTRTIVESRDEIATKIEKVAEMPTGMIEENVNTFVTNVRSMAHELRPSDVTGHLANQFRVCSQCPGETLRLGPVAICQEVLQTTEHILYYGASAWTDVGLRLHAVTELDWRSSGVEVDGAVNSTVHDCYAKLRGLPASVRLKKACLFEQQPDRRPVLLGRLTPPGLNVTGIFNLESLEWRFLQAVENKTMLQQYQMLIIKFYSLEIQSKHLMYLQVLEKLLTHFDLISTNASTCSSWGIPGQSFLMPTVLWATFLRKDLVVSMTTCDTQIPIQNCTDGQATPKFRADFSLLPGDRLGEPEDMFFEIFAQTYHDENPKIAHYFLPHKAVSLDLLRTFRLCHACRWSDLLRVGPRRDGGYLICEEAAWGSSVAISIGIRGDDPFGADLSERFGIRVEGFDCTGGAYKCPRGLKRCNFKYHHQCIGKPFGDKSPSQFITLSEVLDQYTKPTEELILKIDCDGCEWNVLPEIPLDVLRRFRMLVMEVHWLEKQERHPQYLKTMQMLLQAFKLVHSHACNAFGVWTVNGTNFGMPRIVELTFVRRDYATAMPCVSSRYEPRLDIKIDRRFAELGAEAFRLPNQ